jgi:hypothetical protein
MNIVHHKQFLYLGLVILYLLNDVLTLLDSDGSHFKTF